MPFKSAAYIIYVRCTMYILSCVYYARRTFVLNYCNQLYICCVYVVIVIIRLVFKELHTHVINSAFFNYPDIRLVT